MASLARLFAQAAPSGAIASPAAWAAFERAVAAGGHASPLFSSILASLATAVAARRAVTFADVVGAAADLAPDAAVDGALADLEMDAAAVRRFVAFLAPRAPPGSAVARRLEGGAEEAAAAFRATLLHLLRLAVREAAALDAAQREALLAEPVEAALRAEAGPAAGLAARALEPSPHDFQRVHARALAVRLAAVHVRARALARRARLYRTDRALGEAPLAPAPALRAAAVDVFLAARAGADADACAAAGVPFELEVVSLPPLAAVDVAAPSPLTLHAWGALGAAARGGAARDAAAAAAAGAAPVPAPSALPGAPRATLATTEGLFADYAAHSELALSPYFADACGLHEGAEEDAGSGAADVIGLPTLFCYE